MLSWRLLRSVGKKSRIECNAVVLCSGGARKAPLSAGEMQVMLLAG